MFSVIIPTRHNVSAFSRLLDSIAAQSAQIIISDSGFDIGLLGAGLSVGGNLALGREGRGWQLARGAEMANMLAQSKMCGGQDHWMLFLHADSHLVDGWKEVISAHINDHPEKAAYFRFRLDDGGLWPRFIECGVALRCAIFGLPYGDQGLLIRQDMYERLGGYPDWVLFEDVALIRALGRKNLRALPCPLVTDASKYKNEGYMRRSLRNIVLLLKFLCGVSPKRLSASYKKRDI